MLAGGSDTYDGSSPDYLKLLLTYDSNDETIVEDGAHSHPMLSLSWTGSFGESGVLSEDWCEYTRRNCMLSGCREKDMHAQAVLTVCLPIQVLQPTLQNYF